MIEDASKQFLSFGASDPKRKIINQARPPATWDEAVANIWL
jgi:hypothetical protein